MILKGSAILKDIDEGLLKSIYILFNDLVGIKSDTGTRLEIDIENHIYNWLKGLEYFKNNPENLGLYKVPKDTLDRSIIWALRKGKGKRTIILMNHHDVVNSDDYGLLASYAYNPKILMKELKNISLPRDVMDDLEGGDWIFGRGTADMKAGAAIQLALIDKYSRLKDFNGNVLLLSVPDEESLSAGMMGSVSLLNNLKNKHNLIYDLAINSEPHQREEKNVGVIHRGSVGKIMPVIYVGGKQVHVGNVFDGFNPISLLSRIADEVELNPSLSDSAHGEVSPPPSFMYFRDLKRTYDVSLPNSAVGYFTILTLRSSSKDIIDKLKNIAIKASKDTINKILSRHKEYMKKVGLSYKESQWNVRVRTFAQLYEEAKEIGGESFIQDYNNTIDKLKRDIENKSIGLDNATILLIEKTLQYVNNMDCSVIIGFIPPYYPHISNKDFDSLPLYIDRLGMQINYFTIDKWNEEYVCQNYFMGISDMSYFYINKQQDETSYLGSNMPLWNRVYSIPFEEIEKLSIPVINIGPWGKDLHKFTERVYKRDLLERTPMIIEHVIDYIFNKN